MCLTAATFPASSTRGGPVPSLLAAEKAIILGIVQTRWANRPQRAVEGFHAQTLEIFDVPGVAQTRCVSAPSTAPERWWLVAALVLAEALNRPIPWSRHQMGRTARPIVCLISGIVGHRGKDGVGGRKPGVRAACSGSGQAPGRMCARPMTVAPVAPR